MRNTVSRVVISQKTRPNVYCKLSVFHRRQFFFSNFWSPCCFFRINYICIKLRVIIGPEVKGRVTVRDDFRSTLIKKCRVTGDSSVVSYSIRIDSPPQLTVSSSYDETKTSSHILMFPTLNSVDRLTISGENVMKDELTVVSSHEHKDERPL